MKEFCNDFEELISYLRIIENRLVLLNPVINCLIDRGMIKRGFQRR
jgi:hypothetical protein